MTSKTQLGAMFAAIAGLGEDDRAIPYEGGTGVAGHDFFSGENSAKTWAEHNGRSLRPEVTTTSQGNVRSACSDCTKDADVTITRRSGRPHTGLDGFQVNR
jgi:poly(3-hydroxybutyrate) depolymerase